MNQDGSPNSERSLPEGLVHYLVVLLRYRWFIIPVTVLAAAGVVAFSIISLRLPPDESPLPNYYEAYATLLLAEETSGGMAGLLESLGMSPPTGSLAGSGRLVMEVLRSRSFIDTIIETNDLVHHYRMDKENQTRRRGVVTANTRVSYDAPSRILTIGYSDIRPEYAQQVANSIVTELQRYFRDRGVLTRGRAIESLERALADVEREVARIEEQIRAFQQRYGALTVEELAGSQAALLRGLEAERVTLERSIRTYTERTRIENDPELIRMRSERDAVVDLIREIESGYSRGGLTVPARAELPELALRLARMRTDRDIQQRIRTSLQEQYEVARLMAEINTGFTVLEMAEVPDEKTGPSRGRISITVTMGAFLLSIALSLAHHGLKSLRQDPALIGVIARNPTKGHNGTSS